MPASMGTIWAIDLGNDCLKALHLSLAPEGVEVIGFDTIAHGKSLSSSTLGEMEKDEFIALSLRNFVRENNISKEPIIISVPSQNSFARFVTLPPVEEKKIPQVVKLEAGMQIPFDMNEVQWDWQLLSDSSSPEARVGIFAIKNEVVTKTLEYFSGENLQVTHVQMAPMALYNYLLYDRPELVNSDSEATVIINIGADSTDLVVCTKSGVWQRCVTMGGNAFTHAVEETFKINFEKAEKLKKTAPMSKYARQLFQAMRPVYTDLASEIQRSLGFYSNSNPDVKLVRVIAFGGGTKLRGLVKYLQQTLQIPVEKPDSFKKLSISPDTSAAKFHDNVGDFGVVYGLALQGFGLGKIESNLLPQAIAKSMIWASKTKYFIAAAVVLLLVSVLAFARILIDRAGYTNQSNERQATKRIIEDVEMAHIKLSEQRNREAGAKAIIEKAKEPFKYRNIIPLIHETIISFLPNSQNNPPQGKLYEAFKKGDVKSLLKVPRKRRKQIFVTGMNVCFAENIGTTDFGATDLRGQRKRFRKTEIMDVDFPGMMPGMGFPGPGGATQQSGRSSGGEGDEDLESGPGFLVTITGYSPYEKLDELMDPVGVKSDRDNWGLVTRLMNLDAVAEDGNSPFQLYRKTEKQHFELEINQVSLEGTMPLGIGVLEEIKYPQKNETGDVLVDPMTREVISKEPQFDKSGNEMKDRRGRTIYKTKDHWFVLKFKLLWKEAPEEITG